ncbi:DUF427 domain-containing protein, partial [Streptomyces sp. PSKA30]|uniref:DUF427 domain-containing protein n=1 Tax=Streptomyces sp. PSKA30 TaxID=2874597 RepID=UPI001CD0C95E
MMRAVWNGTVLAEAEQTIVVEGNHYFPPESLNREYFTESRARSLCFWKGLARYYTVTVGGQTNVNAAWYYPHPSPLARKIKDHVAFWNGVVVEEAAPQTAGAHRLSCGARPGPPAWAARWPPPTWGWLPEPSRSTSAWVAAPPPWARQ